MKREESNHIFQENEDIKSAFHESQSQLFDSLELNQQLKSELQEWKQRAKQLSGTICTSF